MNLLSIEDVPLTDESTSAFDRMTPGLAFLGYTGLQVERMKRCLRHQLIENLCIMRLGARPQTEFYEIGIKPYCGTRHFSSAFTIPIQVMDTPDAGQIYGAVGDVADIELAEHFYDAVDRLRFDHGVECAYGGFNFRTNLKRPEIVVDLKQPSFKAWLQDNDVLRTRWTQGINRGYTFEVDEWGSITPDLLVPLLIDNLNYFHGNGKTYPMDSDSIWLVREWAVALIASFFDYEFTTMWYEDRLVGLATTLALGDCSSTLGSDYWTQSYLVRDEVYRRNSGATVLGIKLIETSYERRCIHPNHAMNMSIDVFPYKRERWKGRRHDARSLELVPHAKAN